MALAESRSLLVLSCPELDILFGRSAQKRGIEFDKIGLSHPELVYSHRCASIAGPPRNFLTCLDQESPVLESGDRSSNLTLFSGTLCVLVGVRKRGTESRSLLVLSCPELVYSLWSAQKRGTDLSLSELVYSHRYARSAGTAEKLLDFILFKIRRCSNRETGRVA